MNRHFAYYSLMVLVFVTGIVAISLTMHDKQIQIIIAMMLTLFYVGMGILHHYIHHNFTVKIMVEYTLIGSIGLAVLLFILGGKI